MDCSEMLIRIQRLEDIEAIKKVQGKYYRCLDTKNWDELGECFAPDFHTAFSDGRLVFDKWEDLRKFYEENMGVGQQISQHNGHTPEITILSETEAQAFWYLQDILIVPPADWGIQGTAIYDITYGKYDGEWKIKTIGYKRIVEEGWPRKNPEKRRVNENMFDKKLGHRGAVYADGRKK